MNHAMTLEAYDKNTWTMKNSWGVKWGEKGYIRLKTGNTCGVINYAIAP